MAGAAAAAGSCALRLGHAGDREATGWALPGRECPCCGSVTAAAAHAGAQAGRVSYGRALNAAAVVLTAYGNVPPERAAQVIALK